MFTLLLDKTIYMIKIAKVIMHIGIFTDTYYPAINGVSASTQYFTEELVRRGHHRE